LIIQVPHPDESSLAERRKARLYRIDNNEFSFLSCLDAEQDLLTADELQLSPPDRDLQLATILNDKDELAGRLRLFNSTHSDPKGVIQEAQIRNFSMGSSVLLLQTQLKQKTSSFATELLACEFGEVADPEAPAQGIPFHPAFTEQGANVDFHEELNGGQFWT
jgi:hypothetical protein